MAKNKYVDKAVIKRRMLVSFSILFLLFFLLSIRISYIMISQSEHLKGIAIAQWTSEVKISAKRGRILDRNGQELAVSANVYRVDLDMNAFRQTLKDKNLDNETVAPKLAEALGMDTKDVIKILTKTLPNGLPMGSATLIRRIEKAQADKVRELNLRGVLVSSDTKRYYPNDNFLAHVLGNTNSDGNGLNGVELYYNKELSGTPGVRIAEIDNKSKEMPFTISDYTKPIDGKDLVLTIDEMIQHICEKEAVQALNDNKAKAVTIIAMDPNNGEILAMVNKPDVNPNDTSIFKEKTSEELSQLYRNRAVSDTFEPGSIFKVITATAAMEEKVVKEDDTFNCGGSMRVLNRIIRCWKTSGHGSQNFVDILKNSCNVGFMTLGQRIGKENLVKYINLFGFGQKTGIDLPGEAKGIIRSKDKMTDVDLATVSFGQSNTVSCIQYLTALNAIANGGKLVTPHVMKEIAQYNESNTEIYNKNFDNFNERRILDEETMATLRGYLEQVVAEGGGSKAFIEGFHIGGKTGTAQVVDSKTGTYAAGKYVSSFGGMAPANKPILTLMVSIVEPDPSNYYAGQIAAPVAQRLFNDIFNYMALKPDASEDDVAKSLLKDVVIPNIRGLKKEQASKILKEKHLEYEIQGSGEYVGDTNPIPGYTVKEGTKIVLYTGNTSNYNKMVAVPNLRGLSREKAQEMLDNIGLKAEFLGQGLVAEQSINQGREVNKGSTITLTLEEIGD